MTTPTKKPRGLAALPPERRREIASQGGRAAHKAGTAHEFTPEEARIAGRKGAMFTYVIRLRKKARKQAKKA